VFAEQVPIASPDGEIAPKEREMSIVDDLRSLDTNDPGRWPLAIRAGAVAIAVAPPWRMAIWLS
jgi:hypothetical protein